MKFIHTAAAVLNQTPLDWVHNTRNVRQAILTAHERGVGVLCLPELCLTGYGCEDAWVANVRNALLLSTSNRSEAAVGYATMDGDSSGGLSPIAGIDKAFLRQWLRWLENIGPATVHAIPELAVINVQAPTAELRPNEAKQTDEDDLMPYELLDAIERAAIRDKHSPVEVFQLLQGDYPQFEKEQLGLWVERFFRLWSRNQWKRERYAPSFHLDDENLDPKTWCRWPILSGGFEVELIELRATIAGRNH